MTFTVSSILYKMKQEGNRMFHLLSKVFFPILLVSTNNGNAPLEDKIMHS
uniref:Uncharacterized protein n=1 Tax=Arundo donax TaxID=35708 RepID=A0A0A9G256_ARUDO